MASRVAVLIASGGALAAWALLRRRRSQAGDGAPPPSAQAAPTAAQPLEAPPPNAPPGPPAVVHVLHDEGLALEVAEQLAASPTLPRGVRLALSSCAQFKQLAWTGAAKLTVVFVVATCENEQPSEEAGSCVRFFMRRAHADGMLAGKLAYAVLGLGDSNLLLDRQTTAAKDCNQVAQKLDARLAELGAALICARGEADDRTGNKEIEPWLRILERALQAEHG